MILSGNEDTIGGVISGGSGVDFGAGEDSVEAGRFEWGASDGDNFASIHVDYFGSGILIEIIHSFVDFGRVAVAGFHFANIFHESEKEKTRALFFADGVGDFEGVGGNEGSFGGTFGGIFGGDLTDEGGGIRRFRTGVGAIFDVFVISLSLASLRVGASFFDERDTIDISIATFADFLAHDVVKIGGFGIAIAVGADFLENFGSGIVIVVGGAIVGGFGEGVVKFDIGTDGLGEVGGGDGFPVDFKSGAVHSDAVLCENLGGVGRDGACRESLGEDEFFAFDGVSILDVGFFDKTFTNGIWDEITSTKKERKNANNSNKKEAGAEAFLLFV